MTLVIAILRTLTFSKLWALLRAYYAFVLGRVFGKNAKARPQAFVSIEPTNRCNLSCPECVSGSGELTRPRGHMSLANFKHIVDQIYRHTLVLNLYMQGEPYLNPQLPEMIAYAKRKKLFVSLSTNANILPPLSVESLPQHLIISADGATPEGYTSYRRGGDLNKVRAFVRAIAELKQKEKSGLPYVELQFLAHQHNAHERKATRALFKGQYNRFVTKKMQIIHEENRAHFQAQSVCCNRYIDQQRLQPSCFKMISTAVFTQDGYWVACCMDKQAHHRFGNVLEEDYRDVLQGAALRDFRQSLITDKARIAICRNCPYA